MAIETSRSAPQKVELDGFFASYRWPLAAIVALTAISVAAFTPRLIDYLSEGHWGLAATKAFEFAPNALNAHALFGMALLPLFLLQPLLGALLMGERPPDSVLLAHRWQGRLLALAAGVLSLIGLYITYTFAANSDSVTSVVFMLLVALFVILFFAQAVWEARKHRIARHLEALVFAMIFLSLPATGRLIEALMRAFGIENPRSRDFVPIGGGYQVELVDITILLVAAVPIVLWSVFAIPRGVYLTHPAKLAIAALFLGLPLLAIVAQTITR